MIGHVRRWRSRCPSSDAYGPISVALTCVEDDIAARALFLGFGGGAASGGLFEGWQQELWYANKKLKEMRQAALLARASGDRPESSVLPLLLSRRLKYVAADIELVEELRTLFQAQVREEAVEALERGRRSAPGPDQHAARTRLAENGRPPTGAGASDEKPAAPRTRSQGVTRPALGQRVTR